MQPHAIQTDSDLQIIQSSKLCGPSYSITFIRSPPNIHVAFVCAIFHTQGKSFAPPLCCVVIRMLLSVNPLSFPDRYTLWFNHSHHHYGVPTFLIFNSRSRYVSHLSSHFIHPPLLLRPMLCSHALLYHYGRSISCVLCHVCVHVSH